MANDLIRPGNKKTTEITLYDGDQQFKIYDTTITFVVSDQSGVEQFTHTLTVNEIGDVVVSNNLALGPDGPEAGVVIDTTTGAETADLLGWYRWELFVTNSDGETPLEPSASGSWNVENEIPYIVPNGVSRLVIRRRILQKLGDLIVATASEDGSDSTLVDRVRLIGEPNAYRGMSALITTFGQNQGQERYITGSSRDDRSITFDYPLPYPMLKGTEAELINFRGLGYHFDDVNRAIATAVEDAAPGAPEPVIMTNTALFEQVPGQIAIPDDWVGVTGVRWRDADDQNWQNLTPSSRALGSGWYVDKSTRTLSISLERGYRIQDKETQIVGLRTPPIPQNDGDLISIDGSWIVAQCVSLLSQSAYRRSPTPDRQAVMAMDIQDAAILRSRVLRRTGPNTVRF